MLVKELIAVLQKFNQELPVCTNGYEGGVTEKFTVGQILVIIDANKGFWYYGEHETTEDTNGVSMINIG